MARVLAAAGAEVTREFYVNDRGVQMDKFGQSLEASARACRSPTAAIRAITSMTWPAPSCRTTLRSWSCPRTAGGSRSEAGYALQLQQKDVLDNFRTHFDVWYPNVPCTSPARSTAACRSCARKATFSSRTVRCGCAPRTSTTTRTGC